MTRAFRTSSRRRRRVAGGAVKRSRSSNTHSELCAPETLPSGLRLRTSKGRVNRRAGRSASPKSEFARDGTEEIEHEREAAQSARCDRVVCCSANGCRVYFWSRRHADRSCEAAGCRRARQGQDGRKEGREERREKGREEGPAVEVRPESRVRSEER